MANFVGSVLPNRVRYDTLFVVLHNKKAAPERHSDKDAPAANFPRVYVHAGQCSLPNAQRSVQKFGDIVKFRYIVFLTAATTSDVLLRPPWLLLIFANVTLPSLPTTNVDG